MNWLGDLCTESARSRGVRVFVPQPVVVGKQACLLLAELGFSADPAGRYLVLDFGDASSTRMLVADFMTDREPDDLSGSYSAVLQSGDTRIHLARHDAADARDIAAFAVSVGRRLGRSLGWGADGFDHDGRWITRPFEIVPVGQESCVAVASAVTWSVQDPVLAYGNSYRRWRDDMVMDLLDLVPGTSLPHRKGCKMSYEEECAAGPEVDPEVFSDRFALHALSEPPPGR